MADTLPTTSPVASEKSPNGKLLASPRTTQLKHHLLTEIAPVHADLPMLACCFVAGLCDSAAYNAWSCFVSMQTGNTIFLALGASGQPLAKPYGWLKSLVSIVAFLGGCFCFAQTRRVRPLVRRTLACSFAVQALCIFVAAALVQGHVVEAPHGRVTPPGVDLKDLLPLGFLAFQSGGQIVTSRLLGLNEIPTTVLTSVYCDTISDPLLLAPWAANVKRNRRVASVVLLLCGGICGGWVSRSSPGVGMAAVLWWAGALKAVIAICWGGWRGKA